MSPSIQYIFKPPSPALPLPLSNHMSCYLKTNVPNVADTTTKIASDKPMDALMFFSDRFHFLRYPFLWPGSTNNLPANQRPLFFFSQTLLESAPLKLPCLFPFLSHLLPSSPSSSSPKLLIVMSSYSSFLSPPPPTPTPKPFSSPPPSPLSRTPFPTLYAF